MAPISRALSQPVAITPKALDFQPPAPLREAKPPPAPPQPGDSFQTRKAPGAAAPSSPLAPRAAGLQLLGLTEAALKALPEALAADLGEAATALGGKNPEDAMQYLLSAALNPGGESVLQRALPQVAKQLDSVPLVKSLF